jgi:hypothetical protein
VPTEEEEDDENGFNPTAVPRKNKTGKVLKT